MRLIAAIIGILIIWSMWPHVLSGEFLAPDPIAPNTWMSDYIDDPYAQALATPPQGYGFRHYDFWGHPDLEGRPATTDDFRLRW